MSKVTSSQAGKTSRPQSARLDEKKDDVKPRLVSRSASSATTNAVTSRKTKQAVTSSKAPQQQKTSARAKSQSDEPEVNGSEKKQRKSLLSMFRSSKSVEKKEAGASDVKPEKHSLFKSKKSQAKNAEKKQVRVDGDNGQREREGVS